jgi:hypothetical protein
MLIGLSAAAMMWNAAPLLADDDTDRLVGGVVSGLLGAPQQPSYTAKERDRLVSLLQSGDYVTSRQGEPVDLMVYGVPLTQSQHVYTARPVRPSATSAPESR